MPPSLPGVLLTLTTASDASRASSQDLPLLHSMRQSMEVSCQQSISPGHAGAPALLTNMVFLGTFPITGTGSSLSESVQVFPTRLCQGQPALAISSLTPSRNWHELANPSGQLGQAVPAWQGDRLEQQRRGLPHARLPESQAHAVCQHCHGPCLTFPQSPCEDTMKDCLLP